MTLGTKHMNEIKGHFFVPSYQRGYRWGRKEVCRLLDDVYSFGEDYSNHANEKYCLQPVVVLKKDDLSFELIDGQQRLTTLYLIYKYLHEFSPNIPELDISLEYETREQTAQYLREISSEGDASLRDVNIDNWFIQNAYECIKEWFNKDNKADNVPKEPVDRVSDIRSYFTKYVQIIWYEIDDKNEKPDTIFTRLNIGKIPLTSSELVKALFLRSDREKERIKEISLQWDNIEKELQDESLWYFLTNDSNARYQTRIDLVLDLVAGCPPDNREKYYTFYKINERVVDDESAKFVWREIHKTFLVLKDWYEDHELYHKIGYLIASGKSTLRDIFIQSNGKRKTEFLALLNDLIKKSISFNKDLTELNYRDNEKQIRTLLLLFNVESVRQIDDHSQRFPFDKYKSDNRENYRIDKRGNKIIWTLEHIHAQHSVVLRGMPEWKEWLSLHVKSIEGINRDDKYLDLIDEINNARAESTKLSEKTFKDLQDRVMKVLSCDDNTDYVHSIWNLALLNFNHNAALNNSAFDVKRKKIIEMDKLGEFIPFCTKMVFLKYYTSSENNQIHFWGRSDGDDYIAAIMKVLKDYLPESEENEEA